MAREASKNGSQFADTVGGKILVGVVVAAASAFISWFVSRATFVPPPPERPVARITPSEASVQANDAIEFSAEGSTFPSAEDRSFEWKVSGLPPNESPVARCKEGFSTFSCRFMLPGTFAVSVEVVDANGERSGDAAAISVKIPYGYFGLMLRSEDPDAFRALLYDVDWVKLQSLVSRPIVLQDPDTNLPVYAALADKPEYDGDSPPWQGAASGLKIAVPGLPPDAKEAVEIALSDIGMVPLTLAFAENYTALETGVIDGGFMAIDSPDQLINLNN